MNKKTSILIFSFCFFSITSQMVSAEIFKCTNKQGAVFYNDKPCPKNDKEKKINAVKDPKNGYIPKIHQDKEVKERGQIPQEDKIAIKPIMKKDANETNDIQQSNSASSLKSTAEKSLKNSSKEPSLVKVNVSGIEIAKDAPESQKKKLLLESPGIIE